SRTAILIFAIVLTRYGRNVVWIMVATLFISTSGTLAQGLALKTKMGTFSSMPSWHRKTVSDIATFGTFSWLQAISSVVFSHADRFFVGFFMGAPAVAYYGLCVQAAQPIHGLISSGLHFLFLYLNCFYGIVVLLVMAMLLPKHGLQGAAWARLVYGPITCLAYFYLYRIIWRAEPHTLLPQSPIYNVAATGMD